MTQITTCTGNSAGNLKGFWFRLSDPEDDNSEYIDLPIMGKTGTESKSTCYTIDVQSTIEEIQADDNFVGFVNAISYQI